MPYGISATRGRISARRMISAMGFYIVLAILVAIAILAPIYGVDTRFDQDQYRRWS
jgi:hypothetical protein